MANAFQVLGIVLAGGKGERLSPLTKRAQQTCRPVRGQIPHYRFRAQQPGELGDLLDLRAHAVQEPVAAAASCAMPGSSPTCSRTSSSFPCPPRCARAITGIREPPTPSIRTSISSSFPIPTSSPFSAPITSTAWTCGRCWPTTRTKSAKGTVAALPIPISEAEHFGTMEVDADWRILRFYEKVKDPPEIPGRPGWTLASMGNYVFDKDVLVSELRRDADAPRQRSRFRQEHAARNGQRAADLRL